MFKFVTEMLEIVDTTKYLINLLDLDVNYRFHEVGFGLVVMGDVGFGNEEILINNADDPTIKGEPVLILKHSKQHHLIGLGKKRVYYLSLIHKRSVLFSYRHTRKVRQLINAMIVPT